jgi:outer membrane lipoprotein-sorting protein
MQPSPIQATFRQLGVGLGLLTLAATLTTILAHAAPSAQEILRAADAVRNPDKPYSFINTLIEYRSGKESGTMTLGVYAKADPNSGQFRNLVRFIAPSREANKLMLKTGNDLWFFDPSSKVSIRLSPQQRLLGQAANGDVVSANLARDYTAELIGEEDTVDGDRKPRHCYKLTLSASAADVTYHRIDLWVDTTNSQPIKSKFYAESGRLLKTAYARRYEKQLGTERPTETVIIDGLDPAWVTVMRFTDWSFRDIPDSWLQRDYLPRFKAD